MEDKLKLLWPMSLLLCFLCYLVMPLMFLMGQDWFVAVLLGSSWLPFVALVVNIFADVRYGL